MILDNLIFNEVGLQPSPPCLKIFPKNRPALRQVCFLLSHDEIREKSLKFTFALRWKLVLDSLGRLKQANNFLEAKYTSHR